MNRQVQRFSKNTLITYCWLLFALASIAGLFFYYARALYESHQLTRSNFSSNPVDTVVTELSVKQYNEQGLLTHHLYAPFMQHFAEDNRYFIQTPHLVITEENQAPVDIYANEAQALTEETIVLKNHVVIQQKKYGKREAIKLTTEEIAYFPKKQYASTRKPITIEQAQNQVQAIGMNIDLAKNNLELLHQVRGKYEPRS